MSPTSPTPRRTARPAASLATIAIAMAATVALAPLPAAAAAAPSAAPAVATAPADARLLRTALIVADVERALRFYALLGYAPESEMGGPREPDKTAFPLNAASTRFRLVILGSKANPEARIGLVWFDAPRPAASRATKRRLSR